MEKGLIHIYCGNGKGKTTAAVGLAVRAAGAGKKVFIVQMMKGGETSELDSLSLIPNITITRPYRNFGFSFSMTGEDKAELTECHNRLLENAYNEMKQGYCDMLIIDEFCAAYNKGLVDKDTAYRIIAEKNECTELVLTGRDPDERILAAADYISEINCVRHPYEKGITARKGIEY